MTIYYGRYSAYEEYYAIADTYENCKKMLWAMYKNNFYGRPTKEDRAEFEETVNIEKISNFDLSKGFGVNTKDYQPRANYRTLKAVGE